MAVGTQTDELSLWCPICSYGVHAQSKIGTSLKVLNMVYNFCTTVSTGRLAHLALALVLLKDKSPLPKPLPPNIKGMDLILIDERAQPLELY